MADQSPERPRIVRFGTFEADLGARELRKGGVRIKLQGQPFEVLAMLLERPGEVVPREELRQRLWSTDAFVDFDAGVNTAINRLREALGDSPKTRASLKRCHAAGIASSPTWRPKAQDYPQPVGWLQRLPLPKSPRR